ncbi:MAG: choice-of-anchor J domain-containing protein [Phycisphaerales bacterium]
MKMRNWSVTALSLAMCAGLAHGQAFNEDFALMPDPVTGGGALPADWFAQNNCPLPHATPDVPWYQGQTVVFTAHAGVPNAYAATNYARMSSGSGTLSVWLGTPMRTLNNGDSLSFFTRTVNAPAFPDRLQVRMNTTGSTNVGTLPEDVGDFTILMLDINPGYSTAGYPNTWTLQNVMVSGLGAPTPGRFAFRYFVENGGPAGANSDYIGVDTVSYAPAGATTGACCFVDGTCTPGLTQGACTGTWHEGLDCAQANCPQPPSGACCKHDGTCEVLTVSACRTAAGRYQGDNTTCTNCPTRYAYAGGPVAIPDDGATHVCGSVLSVPIVVGDSFTVQSVDVGIFITHTWQGDIKVGLRHPNGTFVQLVDRPAYPEVGDGFSNDNYGDMTRAPVPFFSTDTQTVAYDVPQTGVNNVSGSWRSESPLAAFNGLPSAGTWNLEIQDCYGPNIDTGTLTGFTLHLGGPGGPAPCYANCDNSTQTPVLNVADFGCFLTKYAAGDPYANCDASTQPPVLNVADFGCFLTKYAAGCP